MIINGKAIAEKIQSEIKKQIEKLYIRKPCLAVILVGNHVASQIYVKRKMEACALIGIKSISRHFSSEISEKILIREIQELNNNPEIDGILIQLPLPQHLASAPIISHLSPHKDVDGLHPLNVGKLLIGDPEGFVPCTPLGIKVLLEESHIGVQGKHVVMVGRSNLVGKPTAALLMQNDSGANGTVTVAHQYTKNLKGLCLQADILIVAVGKPKFITADMVSEQSIVIDVGINTIDKHEKKYRIVGDTDFDEIKDKCAAITPVPGGVGPMTIAMLLHNTLKSYMRSYSKMEREQANSKEPLS